MNSEKKLEYEALIQFVSLIDGKDNIGKRVHRVIQDELTQRQRELINLYYIDQISMSEIARRLELSPSTVSRTLTRGRARIRKYLKYNGRSLLMSFTDLS